MEPMYRLGTVLWVDPRLSVAPDDLVILQLTDDDGGTVLGYIRQLVATDDKTVQVRLFNPHKVDKLPRSRVHAVQRVAWLRQRP
jgi:phage repressor protein C with HTH and peptisase S24 domain